MAAEDGESLVNTLARAGISARVIGSLTGSNNRLILNGGEVRYMDRPGMDEIYKGMGGIREKAFQDNDFQGNGSKKKSIPIEGREFP